MNNTKRIIVAVVIVLVVVGGALWYFAATAKKTAAPANNSGNNSSSQPSGEIASTITYDGSTFSVSKDKIKSGSSVKVVNNSDKTLDFDSDPHPVHTDNTELNEGEIPAGESRTFTLTKVGEWGFHNHLDASQNGKITVE